MHQARKTLRLRQWEVDFYKLRVRLKKGGKPHTVSCSLSPNLNSSERIWILKSSSSPRLIKALISCMQTPWKKKKAIWLWSYKRADIAVCIFARKLHVTNFTHQNKLFIITVDVSAQAWFTLRAIFWLFMPSSRGWNLSASRFSASSVMDSKTRSWLQKKKNVNYTEEIKMWLFLQNNKCWQWNTHFIVKIKA